MSRSAAIRQALEAYAAKGGVTFGDTAGHLRATLHGPTDLSFNKQRMKGYGR